MTVHSTVQYNTVQYNTIQYNTIQYNTIPRSRPVAQIQSSLTKSISEIPFGIARFLSVLSDSTIVTMSEQDELANDDKFKGDIVKFMTNMQLQIRNDIKENNDNLKSEIKENNDKLKKEIFKGMKKINSEIIEVKEDIKAIKADTDKVNQLVKENQSEAGDRFARMERRMEVFENEKDKQDIQKRKRTELANIGQILPAGGPTSVAQEGESNYFSPSGDENRSIGGGNRGGIAYSAVAKGKVSECGKVKATETAEAGVIVEELQFKSTWARAMSQVSLEKQLFLATEAADRMERKGERQEPRKKEIKKPLLLGNSLDRHDPLDWPWETSEEDWEGTEDKVQRNLEKKKRQRLNKQNKIEKAAKVGRCTLGLGPIKLQSIDYFFTITGDYEEAKQMAAVEFLTEYLQFDHDDMTDMQITDTKISQKKDDILYIVFGDPDIVKNVRRRVADCQNSSIRMRDFIPPQFFDRYSALAKYASEIRTNDKSKKTQIRFGESDLILLTKTRGSDELFLPLDMSEIAREKNKK